MLSNPFLICLLLGTSRLETSFCEVPYRFPGFGACPQMNATLLCKRSHHKLWRGTSNTHLYIYSIYYTLFTVYIYRHIMYIIYYIFYMLVWLMCIRHQADWIKSLSMAEAGWPKVGKLKTVWGGPMIRSLSSQSLVRESKMSSMVKIG